MAVSSGRKGLEQEVFVGSVAWTAQDKADFETIDDVRAAELERERHWSGSVGHLLCLAIASVGKSLSANAKLTTLPHCGGLDPHTKTSAHQTCHHATRLSTTTFRAERRASFFKLSAGF